MKSAALIVFLALLTPAFAAADPVPPSGTARGAEEKAVEAYGDENKTCAEWSDGCAVCVRATGGAAACSLPGIACEPQAVTCRNQVATPPKP